MVETLVEYHEPRSSREERKLTGKYTAAILVVLFCTLGLYHAFIKQNRVLAGLIVPVLIMGVYLFWVLHLTKRSLLEQEVTLHSVVSTNPHRSQHVQREKKNTGGV